ncbi:aldehyde dehydrogenase [Aldersonia kunmingensis]|uniref:aldehyde dehydrogenase n=1 Tax=Aldersonia kunmingensis TaxID=408066 RepID=UPI0008325C0B|nr:aldehyde dehydrogenase [Aldersonia kunmingensis]
MTTAPISTLAAGEVRTHDRLFIGGRWIQPHGGARIEVVSPNTEEILGTVPDGSLADVDAAVAAARAAFDNSSVWSGLEPAVRAGHLRRFADEIDVRKDELAGLVSAQNGMPIAVAGQLEAVYPSTLLRYYADLIENQAEDVRQGMFGGLVEVRRDPIGVVGAIVPWNFPQTLAAFKFAPALAAGCTLVIKPSPETVLDSFVLAEAAEAAGLPAGVINIVPGGREAGAHLVAHPGVDKVAFTGSTPAGIAIAETCGRLLRPVTLELGGKSATIVLDDAELDLATIGNELFVATLANNGQTCFLGTRVLAPRARYGEVVDVLTAFAESMAIGDSRDPGTQIGPMATARHRERVEGYIAAGRSEGGRITTGGGRPADQDRGWFVQPTVFADVDNKVTIAREEIFGPVLSVIAYDGDDDAVAIANDSDFGLGGTVWSSDPDRARAVASRVKTGTIGINRYIPDPIAPFGGIKQSGMGRELGPEGLAAYQNIKSIYR